MHKLILWLKRNFTVSICALIVSIISALMAYNRYLIENGGQITPVLYSSEANIPNRTVIICVEDDTVKLYGYEFCRRFMNTSKYAMKYSKASYTIVSNPSNVVDVRLDVSKKYDFTESFFDISTGERYDNYVCKFGDLYQDDITPNFLDTITLIPRLNADEDTISFNVEEKFYWNTNAPISFKTKFFILRMGKKEFPIEWSDSVIAKLKGIMNKGENYEVILFPHNYSINDLGSSQFRNININNIDSLNYIFDHKVWAKNHLYQFKNLQQKKIKWNNLMIGSIFLILILLINLICYKERISNFIVINCMSIPFYIIGLIYFRSVFLYFDFYNAVCEKFLMHFALYLFMAECLGTIFYFKNLRRIYKYYSLLFKLIVILYIFAGLFFALLIE